MIVSVVIAAAACSAKPSQRPAVVLNGPNGKITCFEPPPDVMTAEAKAAVNANISKVVDVLKVESNTSTTYSRIRQEVPNLQATEALEFRLCTEYGNGIISKDQYHNFLSVLPLLKSGQPIGSSTGQDASHAEQKKEAVQLFPPSPPVLAGGDQPQRGTMTDDLPIDMRVTAVRAYAREAGVGSWQPCASVGDDFDCNLGWARFRGNYKIVNQPPAQRVEWTFENWSASRPREAKLEVAYYAP